MVLILLVFLIRFEFLVRATASVRLKKGIFGVGSSTSCHVTTIDNTTCITQALLELSLEYNSIGPHHASSTYQLLSTNQRSFSNKEKKKCIKQRKHCVPSGIMEIVMGRVSKLGWDNVDFKYLYTEDSNDIFPIQ